MIASAQGVVKNRPFFDLNCQSKFINSYGQLSITKNIYKSCYIWQVSYNVNVTIMCVTIMYKIYVVIMHMRCVLFFSHILMEAIYVRMSGLPLILQGIYYFEVNECWIVFTIISPLNSKKEVRIILPWHLKIINVLMCVADIYDSHYTPLLS